MNAGIDVAQIQRFGALYITAARLKSISKWKMIIAAVDIGNPLFYLIAVGVGIGVLVEQGSGTSGTSGIKYIAFIAPALLANSAIAAVMDETIFPTIEGFKWRKLFFAQNATPITGRQIALGVYLSALCRAIASVQSITSCFSYLMWWSLAKASCLYQLLFWVAPPLEPLFCLQQQKLKKMTNSLIFLGALSSCRCSCFLEHSSRSLQCQSTYNQ